MGTSMFKHKAEPSGPKIGGGNLNMMARAQGAPAYSVERGMGNAGKDLAAAAAFGKAPSGPVKKSAASDAPGPKV